MARTVTSEGLWFWQVETIGHYPEWILFLLISDHWHQIQIHVRWVIDPNGRVTAASQQPPLQSRHVLFT